MGGRQVVKAPGFGSGIRRFESYPPSVDLAAYRQAVAEATACLFFTYILKCQFW